MLTPSVKSKLRQAWAGPLSREFLARRYGISDDTVGRFWREEQSAGRLPATPRPHFAEFTSKKPLAAMPTPANTNLATSAPHADDDGDETAYSFQATNEQRCAESLAALKRAHPEMNNARAQTSPDVWLVRDCDAALAPTRGQMVFMARKMDQGAYR